MPADSERHRSCANEIDDVVLVDAAGSNKRNPLEWRLERLDITWTANLSTGEDLDEVRPGLPHRVDLTWRQRAWKHDSIVLDGELHDLGVGPWRGQKRGSRVQTVLRRGEVEYASCAHGH